MRENKNQNNSDYGHFLRSDMVLNPGKCHYMLIGNENQPGTMHLNGTETPSSNDEKLLGLLMIKNQALMPT